MYGPRPGRPVPPAPPKFSWTPYIVMGVVLFIILALAPRIGLWPMLLVFFFGMFVVRRVLAYFQQRYDERSATGQVNTGKRKTRPYRASSAYVPEEEAEKPKRRPEYTVGDDGELVELDAALEEDKPKRGQSGSDTFV